MSDDNLKAPSPDSLRGKLETPRFADHVYDEAIFLSGWVHSSDFGGPFSSVRAFLDGVCIGKTHTPFYRPDVCAEIGLSKQELTGFRIFGRIPPGYASGEEAMLRVAASWDGQSFQTLAEQAIKIIPALLPERPHGKVVAPENRKVLHRADIYGSGPPLENPSVEIRNLLLNYLPAKATVLDVGCGAGAYGPSLMAAEHVWLGLEQSQHCCDILERRRLPFRRMEAGSRAFPCEGNEWDCAICVEVLEHVQEPEAFVRELDRVTSRRVLISVPNMEVLPYMHGWGVVPWHMLEADHKNFFTRASLITLLERFFRQVEVFPYGAHPLLSREKIVLYQHLFAVADH